MTLEELLEANAQAGELHICVRDYSGNGDVLIKSYHIGSQVTKDRYPVNGKERWEAICEPINTREVGKDYWQIIKSVIPKALLQMQIFAFSVSPSFTTNNGLNKFYHFSISLIGKDKPLKEIKKTLLDDVEEDGQLKGQISFL